MPGPWRVSGKVKSRRRGDARFRNCGLFGLGEQEHDPGAFWSVNLPLHFLGALRGRQPVAGLVISGFSIHDDDVPVRVVPLNIAHDDMPGPAGRIITQGDLPPLRERADDFNFRWLQGLPRRHGPAENFSEALPGLAGLGKWV